MTEKLTEARIKANKKWDEDNKERKQYLNTRSVARNFIKKRATLDDINELKELIKIREEELK
ncbi:hypothetical protein M5C72_08400 [Companilactobacillus allii]|uniref:Uncharacterized protein n=1 Tax=Companilactobacillus allii TaxID=1847728 RepID=A0A1P8Q5H9_9LACO|nr:hypothetical protein [Companilactobacillus allii]APX73101.1 hypothetical protein BTM29_11305 [Companilactobacillus allii]USQ67902.1 hypothetical protein M5C72_08400 [Companilactobacillus allii]